jgi:hypothetical protein
LVRRGGVGIANRAHIGGLLAGAWIALAVPPLAPTLATAFTRPGEAPQKASPSSVLLQLAAVTALVAVIGVGVAFGTAQRTSPPVPGPLVVAPVVIEWHADGVPGHAQVGRRAP